MTDEKIKNSRELEFAVFCIENVAAKLGVNAERVYQAFTENKKCELVTPILHYEDIELLQELIRKLRHAGAKSDATRGCGVHIHIGAKGHTPQTLRNLANIMAGHENLLADALNLYS